MFEDLADFLGLTVVLAILLVLFIALSGCGSKPSPDLEDALVEATAAISAASYAAGGGHLVGVVGGTTARGVEPLGVSGPGLGWRVVPVLEDTEAETKNRWGYYDGHNGGRIYVSLNRPVPPAVILIHEIGHAFGLEHSGDPHSIMFGRARIGWTVEAAAQSLVAELIAHDPGPFRVGR